MQDNTVNINVNFDIENYMFRMLSNYLETNSRFITDVTNQVFPKAPKSLTTFPTVVIKETNNVDDMRHNSLDRTQLVNQITSTIEIYTKDIVLNGVRYASKTVMSELKYLVFDFFENCHAQRVGCEPLEYYDNQVDRLLIIERYSQANWNRKIG